MNEKTYPSLTIDLTKLRSNATEVIRRCRDAGISVCGVIKGCNGNLSIAHIMEDCGAEQLASTQLSHLTSCRNSGIRVPLMLLRVPSLSEISSVVASCDITLQSEVVVIDAMEQECAIQNKLHSVILMADLGDLREGYWDKNEFLSVCEHIENHLPHIHLMGIGVNLSCYGSIRPTPEKMNELIELSKQVEQRIGRKLEIVSGGNTTSYALVHHGTMPSGINHLRIGETILLGYDLHYAWGCDDMDYIYHDALTLEAEIVEVKVKPSMPQGERFHDCFGLSRTYVDRGLRKRALLSFGRYDAGDLELLIPTESGIEMIGGSSDYCIVDVTDCPRDLKVGDTLKFTLQYANMLYLTTPDRVKNIII